MRRCFRHRPSRRSMTPSSKIAEHAGDKNGGAAEPCGDGKRTGDRRQGRQRKHDQGGDRQHAIDQNGQHDLAQRQRKPPRQPDAGDVAADGAERQAVEENAGVEHRLHARHGRRRAAHQSAEYRAPALAAEKDLGEKENRRNGEPAAVLRCQQTRKSLAVDSPEHEKQRDRGEREGKPQRQPMAMRLRARCRVLKRQ